MFVDWMSRVSLEEPKCRHYNFRVERCKKSTLPIIDKDKDNLEETLRKISKLLYKDEFFISSALINFTFENDTRITQLILETEYSLRKYVSKNDKKTLDWGDSSQRKWFLVYDSIDHKIKYDYTYMLKHPRQVYSSSSRILEDAVKSLGEERIVQYLQH